MSVNLALFQIVFFSSLLSLGWTAPTPQNYSRNNRPSTTSKDEYLQTTLQNVKTELSTVKHLLSNQESEIETLQKKLATQENTLDHLHQMAIDELQAQKEVIRTGQCNGDSRLNEANQSLKNLETLLSNSLTDLRKLALQANETVSALSQQQKKIMDLEKSNEVQQEHIQHLEAALHSLMDLIQTRESKTPQNPSNQSGEKTYKVQAGDSLEKIARLYSITLSSLRKANPQLSDDRIRVGQTITIP